MALTLEWRARINQWTRELKNQFYRPLADVEFEGFTTPDRMTAAEALKGRFKPMPAGTKWGEKWEYGWFRATVNLPPEAKGRRIVLFPDLGGESAIYVNGAAAGARDGGHFEITLTRRGVSGANYEILVEAYAGHGVRVGETGPLPPDRESVPEPELPQTKVGRSTFGVWEEDVYQLWLDVETLIQVRDNLDKESLRVAEIDAGLRDYTLIADLELPRERMLETVRSVRERLKPLLACTNGSTAPVVFGFGHAHIDMAWLWPLAETERKCVRTFSTQLSMMEEYPEYRFLQSQPHLYWMTKTLYPDLYERIKAAVRTGNFIPEGGMWVEADTNVTGGESLIRQFIHGKRFFREEFGVESEILWLPDVFGYSGALPQILLGCGAKYFSTAKLFWNYYVPMPKAFPYNTFWWEGIDGSRVLSHMCTDYNSHSDPASVISRWNERVQKDGIATRMMPFGFGDGGGGVTRNHLEFLRRERDLEGVPRVVIASPNEFFRDVEKRGAPDARHVGEIYYQMHRGTYTSQARTKRLNRKSELALREAELWGAAAQALNGYCFPLAEMDTVWKKMLLNQFHDVLPGSSIHRVYEEANAAFQDVIKSANRVTSEAAAAFTDTGKEAVTVFNSLSWDRTVQVPLPGEYRAARVAGGETLPVQVIEKRTLAEVAVPSCGWVTLEPATPAETPNNLKAAKDLLENDFLRIRLNEKGEIVSLFDKEAGFELAAGPGNCFRMYKDVPSKSDAWDIDSMYRLTPVNLEEEATVTVVASGPLAAVVRVSRKLNDSVLRQDIILRRNSRRVDFQTTVDWREKHKLLKVCFPVHIMAHEGIHEIQFGHIRRPNHASQPSDAEQFEVCNQKWSALAEENRGVAVLNDCKYGVNIFRNSINLTLLRAPVAPDMTADRGFQEFTYSLYCWKGSFGESGVVREAYDLNCPATTAAGAAGTKSLFSLSASNVVIETVKPAEDGSRDVVVRLYEAKRMRTRCALAASLPVRRAWIVNMLEQEGDAAAEMKGGAVLVELSPFEIKTIRLCL